jgi:hypothetical protein
LGGAAQGNLLTDFLEDRHVLSGKGVVGKGGDHVALVKVWTPKKLDSQTVAFAHKLASLEKTRVIN